MDDARQADVYTFGTNPTAAHRLDLLAQVYDAGSRALLARWAPDRPEHAVDLGCGPGHTARLLHQVTRAARTTGVERSAEYLAIARATPEPGLTFVQADVTSGPLPVDAADVVHVRFLVTHLAAPGAALRLWGDLLRPGGRLIVQEVARLVSREPALGRYYELVAQLQEHHGQALDVGARLAELARSGGLRVEHQAIRPWHPPTAAMAALHVLNLHSWRDDRYARTAFDPDELDALAQALAEIAHGRPTEPIEQDLAELVLTLTP
jgi:SAM-dependent methyltransferase